jgi:RecB family endonuclease NucS
MYTILNAKPALRPFRPTELGSKYHERQLECWLESSPQVLIEDEPLLVIGRQINSPVGVIDLMALDADTASVIVELKRGASQREAVSQVLEYAAWLSTLDSRDLGRNSRKVSARVGSKCVFERCLAEHVQY